MIKEFIGTGSTLEAATNAAKAGLNAPALADIKIEVIEMPKKKVLGIFGGRDAKVKASYEDLSDSKQRKSAKKDKKSRDKKPQQASKKSAPSPKKEVKSESGFSKEKEQTVKEALDASPREEKEHKNTTPATEQDAAVAKEYLEMMLKGLKTEDFTITSELDGDTVKMEIVCEDYGIIIGRRGETLDALQYLTSLAIKKTGERFVRVTINVGNYREKRAETLCALARKNASYVARTGRRYTFEPMNPYERRIIHTAIQEFEGVESRSIGYNQDRRVVLEPTGGVRSYGSSRYGSRGGRRGPRPASVTTAPANTTPRADRADLPKFGKIEINKD